MHVYLIPDADGGRFGVTRDDGKGCVACSIHREEDAEMFAAAPETAAERDRLREMLDAATDELTDTHQELSADTDALAALVPFLFGRAPDGSRYCSGCAQFSGADEREPERHGHGCPVAEARSILTALARARGESVNA